jgi:predicted O-methyltransferase YrrM
MVMTQETWNSVDRYIIETLVEEDDALRAASTASSEAGLPPIAVSPPQGKLLYFLALLRHARNILEIGTLGGYSAIWLARALPDDGRVLTLEVDPHHAEVARNNIERAGLSKVVEVRLGKALDILPKLSAEITEPFDLVFIDADKASTPDYLSWAIELSAQGGVIVVDNVVRNGHVVEADTTDASVQGIRKANELLVSDPRVSATALQTVGVKGYDGFAVALVGSQA